MAMGFFLEEAAYQAVRFALAPVLQSPRTSFFRKYWKVLSAALTDASSTSARSRWVLAKDHDAVRASLLRLAHHDADRRAEVGARHGDTALQ